MLRRFFLGIALAALALLPADAASPLQNKLLLSGGCPSSVKIGSLCPTLSFNFATNQGYSGGKVGTATSFITTVRASPATSLLPTSASGAAYISVGNNVPLLVPGLGIQIYEGRTNQLLNSTAPATQTTGSLGTGVYTLWVNGSGSAQMSLGTGVGCGTGTATNGTPVNFTISVAGTCIVTVTGTLNAFQLELGTFGTPLIVTVGSALTRAADVVTVTSPPAFGSAYTFYLAVIPNAPASYSTAQLLIDMSDGTTSNRFSSKRIQTTSALQAFNVSNTTETDLNLSGSSTTGTAVKIAAATTAGDQAGALNGGAIVTGSGSLPIGVNSIRLGNSVAGFSQLNGYITRVAVWPTTRLPNATAQNITVNFLFMPLGGLIYTRRRRPANDNQDDDRREAS